MFSDNELNRLEDERDRNIADQTKLQREIEQARDRLDDELEKVKRDWGGRVKRLEDEFKRLHERLPELTAKINARKSQLERENKSKAT